MNLSPADRSTVAKLLGLIGSQHDAEALAAARKAHQLVTQHGATWQTVFGIEPPPAEADHAVLARDLMARGKPALTIWERNFLIGIMAFKTLKPKQVEILDAIISKVDAATQ